ncbi:MAG: polymer-forming cytoskeletal protein, partial [Chloroflexi bacterium]
MTLSTRRPVSRVPTPVPAENGANGGRNSVVLGPKDRLVGQLYIEGDLQVAGTVDGTLEATGDIEIAGGGKVSGAVTAYNRLVV